MDHNHKCDNNCKDRGNSAINCFICTESFFLKCFGIDRALQLKMQAPKTLIKLVCGKCQSKKRQSQCTQPPQPPSNDSHLLKQVLDKISLITAPLLSAPPQNPTNANFSTENITQTDQNLTIENIYKSVLKLSDKVDKLHSADNESKSMAALTLLISSKVKDLTESLKQTQTDIDFLDNSKLINWSMTNDNGNNTIANTGRASISVKQSVDEDVLNMLKNSDKLTWDTLDIIKNDIIKEIKNYHNKIDEISAQLTTLEPSLTDLPPHISSIATHTKSGSALTDTVKLDLIQIVSDKIDIIDGKVNSISVDIAQKKCTYKATHSNVLTNSLLISELRNLNNDTDEMTLFRSYI